MDYPPSEFHMPAESAPHERTFMQWPSSSRLYQRGELDAIQNAVVRLANTIAEHEPVVMLSDRTQRTGNKVKLAANVELWDIPTDDLWCRDSGPTFVVSNAGDLAIAHLRFNGWGGKQVHGRDGRIAARVADRLGVPLIETGLIGEQGGVEHDGAGLMLAHASSWMGAARNDLPLRTIGNRLCAALGSSHVIWAPGLVNADITDFHIDALARFTAPGKVLIQLEAEQIPATSGRSPRPGPSGLWRRHTTSADDRWRSRGSTAPHMCARRRRISSAVTSTTTSATAR